MGEKSHVSMGQHQCVVCLDLFDSGEVLIHKRLAQVLDRHSVTGRGFCPEHQKLKDDGYIAIIEVDNETTRTRTGRIAYLKDSAWPKVFDAPVPREGVAMVGKEIMDALERNGKPL